ncbi:23S rRNA (pseudouridine(1915)-N(3))-methyltransferase RlmH [Pseudenhygromyxa sp. WMMC2535]|uniref:23S rRNA (pseudouridine(1915)-N(3))-methyltransferase RlmH n=1 Tax=Pseudenhygromyxa sp. WMMC2535 TaxID=2712867 RepID=UPI00155703D2|nr:23S rRNA (pseudouridine(1915)-N(3))-methyltransferase RlmH [Pseudenhygromyxa sp. WMMC2535]NVB39775.1 23S rRNA (pseudouridine(1915)-N(3))-methyltransferase RlmH [Pseudenhygromyxa sp. WMMC2535]
MRLRLLAVGKLKQPGLEALVEDYRKRSRSFLPIEALWLRDMNALRSRARAQPEAPKVLLDERGELLDSEGLAAWLGDWRDRGVRCVDFMIGDAHGFEDSDRGEAERVLALSRMTLPHRLAQVLLVEQLYRAGTILAGHPYHH